MCVLLCICVHYDPTFGVTGIISRRVESTITKTQTTETHRDRVRHTVLPPHSIVKEGRLDNVDIEIDLP